ncbi:glycoside hydrolase family 9 protein [Stakelama saccharophila]|uniref:Glycoside hydrolase family 9 protein n=1 Tax=Stakelama saccharophila TaxID=3075605 RepID=A0ABZ0B9I1_9SPHN|nr:glycoside hydrolase family 9 protein [Stakelama sp. W311]WNO54028.1 glycoside hydrolase family 9 protein [Stakelama sp. W311]
MPNRPIRIAVLSMIAMAAATALPARSAPESAARQAGPSAGIRLTADYYTAPAVNVLVFSNWYDGLFADSKISGIEIIEQGERIATNGDVRLSATPGQWDAIGRLVDRRVDTATGVIEAELEYPDQHFRYVIRAEPRGGSILLSVRLPEALPAALAGKAGFNLEFLPAAYFHKSYLADGKAGGFPLYPASAMERTAKRNPASGRSDGPGAEPLPMATGSDFVLAPSDPARRVHIRSDRPVMLYDGRNQAQNGWFVLRSLLPAGKTGTVLQWTVTPNSVPGWLRTPVIGHSQLGYTPSQTKVATIELDRGDTRRPEARLLRVTATGDEAPVRTARPSDWGDYLRYHYLRFDFSDVRTPGLYVLEYGDSRTAPFRIADDLYADAWHPTLDIYFPVAMDHMFVNEAYRVWHGAAHMDDARQAPVDHEHLDLYAQGPTTDTDFAPGEHIPGLNVGGWFDAGDFDIRTQTQYGVVRSMVRAWERFAPKRDTTSVDERTRRVEMHVPDGAPDLLQQIRHGTLQLVAQFDAVGHAINGIVAPDVGQYTHLGDAASKTDGYSYDPSLEPYDVKDGRSGTPDDRWAFTSKASALDYGSAAGLAAASRALKGFDDALAGKALTIAERVWRDEHSHAPDEFRHGNTTGGPLNAEEFAAAVELLKATRKSEYAERIQALWPTIADSFTASAVTAAEAIPYMPATYREAMIPAVQAWQEQSAALQKDNPYGVPVTTGGWAGSGAVQRYGLTAYALHRAFPDIVPADPVFRSLAFLLGNHPGSDISFVSGVGSRSKEVAYGNNRADFSFIAGGVVPGALIIKPGFPENHEDWPFFWGENEYVTSEGAAFIELTNAAAAINDARYDTRRD